MTACFWQVIPCRIGVGKCHHLIICSLFFYETNPKSLSVLGEALGSLGLSSTANQPRCRSRTWKRTILKKACMRKEEQDAAQQCLKVITVCTFFLKHEPHDLESFFYYHCCIRGCSSEEETNPPNSSPRPSKTSTKTVKRKNELKRSQEKRSHLSKYGNGSGLVRVEK